MTRDHRARIVIGYQAEGMSSSEAVLYTMYVRNGEPVADWVSENITRITGYQPYEVIQPGWWSARIHAEDTAVETQANEALLDMGFLTYEYRFRFADGGYHWLRDEMRVVKNSQDGSLQIFGVWRDITHERAMREKLMAQEERLRFTLQATGDGMWDWYLQENVIYWSDTNFELLGLPVPKDPTISFEQWRTFVHPDDLAAAEAQINDATRIDGDKLDVEFRLRHSEGHWVWIECRGQVIEWDENGRPIRMLGLHTDVSERKSWDEALKARERLLTQFTRHVPGMLYQFVQEPDGRMYFPFASERIRDIYGITPEEAKQDAWNAAQNIHPDDVDGAHASIMASAESMEIWRHEFRVNLPHKGERWLRGEARPERSANGVLTWHGYIMDITNEKAVERELKLASSVFKNTHEGIMITDTNAVIIEVNPTFTSITGYSRNEALGQKPTFLKSGRHDHSFYVDMWEALQEHGFWQGEIWNKKKNGTIYCERKTISAILDDEGQVTQYVGLFSDITQLKQQQQRLEQLAHYDSLTNLPNRTLFQDRLYIAMEAARRSGAQITLVYIDLDDFKPVNDTLGHAAGDRLLEVIAKRLSESVRKSDTVARIGGDEFLLLLSHESVTGYRMLLKRLQKSLCEPIQIEAHEVTISSSIGVAHFPQDAENGETLLRCADQAMYAAKQQGKNKVVEYRDITHAGHETEQ
ncbi:MAG: PAS domain-containing protein [Idiomarina sp.]|nr:PAS domain-containing protein [Idiomarina sp.]